MSREMGSRRDLMNEADFDDHLKSPRTEDDWAQSRGQLPSPRHRPTVADDAILIRHGFAGLQSVPGATVDHTCQDAAYINYLQCLSRLPPPARYAHPLKDHDTFSSLESILPPFNAARLVLRKTLTLSPSASTMAPGASWTGTPAVKGSSEVARMALLTFSMIGIQYAICARARAPGLE